MKFYNDNKRMVWGLIIGSVIVSIVGSILVFGWYNAKKTEPTFYPASNQILATPSAITTASITTQAPTLVLTPTPTPISTNQWVVVGNSEEVKIGGYVYAIVTFENLGNHERKRGQCQQPLWDLPEIGHVYTLNNTYGDFWLFIPIEGVEDQKYQRFELLQNSP